MEDIQQSVEEFLAKIEKDGVREYYRLLFNVIDIIDPPITEVAGLACIKIIETTTIHFKNGRNIGIDDTNFLGTIGEIAEAIAIVFQTVDPTVAGWKMEYASRQGEHEIVQTARDFVDVLRKAPEIARVEEVLL